VQLPCALNCRPAGAVVKAAHRAAAGTTTLMAPVPVSLERRSVASKTLCGAHPGANKACIGLPLLPVQIMHCQPCTVVGAHELATCTTSKASGQRAAAGNHLVLHAPCLFKYAPW
jgi:hypothetical protein